MDYCKNKVNYKLNSSINHLDIKIDKERKFIIQNGRKVINFYRNNIDKLALKKKKYNSNIIVTYDKNYKCKLEATIRSHGDQADHIKLINGTPISSLRVKLNNGNINGITRFTLFIPSSRNSDNEIFITTLLKELNFLAPRTFYINSKIHNQKIKYLFQESLKKELLEINNYVEGPIIEKREDFWKNPDILQMSKIANNEWIKGDNSNFKISIQALSKWNRVLLNSYKDSKTGKRDDIVRFGQELFKKNEFKLISEFDALMFALDAHHGLSFDDRRFYFDPISKEIIPIYYDGMSKILSLIGYNFKLDKYQKSISSSIKPSKIFYDEKDFDPSYLIPFVTFSAKLGATDAIKNLNKIKIKELQNKLEMRGINKRNIDENKLENLIRLIIERLKRIQNSKIKEYRYTELTNPYTKFYMKNMDKEKYLLFLNNVIENENSDKLLFEIEICEKNLENCIIETLDKKNFENILEGKEINKKYSIFLSVKKENFLDYVDKNSLLTESVIINDKKNNIKILFTKDVKISYNDEEKTLKLNYKDSSGRVLISQSNLDNIKIKLEIRNQDNKIIRSKYAGLTGCLTILESNLYSVELNAKDFACEDTINFIRSKGNLVSANIVNAAADSLDADFSNLNFENINIDNSKNDCLDFSFGKYQINYATLMNCGDKGISVGENSILDVNFVEIKNSLMGIVSKDSSLVNINENYIENTDTCYSAYKKKQEFNGSVLSLNKEICKKYNSKYFTDKVSNINFF